MGCRPVGEAHRGRMASGSVTSYDGHVVEGEEHGRRPPRGGAPIPPDRLARVVVPGLAFDAHGHRLGRGGGYYDRFLGRLRRTAATVGLGFDVQITDEVPVNDGDVSVDIVVTDRRVTHARGSRTRG